MNGHISVEGEIAPVENILSDCGRRKFAEGWEKLEEVGRTIPHQEIIVYAPQGRAMNIAGW